jgi:hypothetical protein
MTTFETAAADIAALGTEAGGCDCVYSPEGGSDIQLKAVINSKPVFDASQGRGSAGVPTQTRQLVTFLIQRTQDGVVKVPDLKVEEFLTVPGQNVSKAVATVKLRVKSRQLIQGSHWTGELHP